MKQGGTLNLPKGWEIKKLGEVCEIINGGTPKTNIAGYWDGDIHWITPADLGKLIKPTVDDTPRKISKLGLEKSSAKLFPENSLILSTRAPIGHLAINEVPMSTNQGCRGIVPSKKLDAWFLYYFLKKNVELLDSLGTGATFKELSTKALAGVKIPIPPLPEQQRIVSILDEAFAAIAKAKANAEQNLKNARELFESYLQGVFEDLFQSRETKSIAEIAKVIGGYSFKSTDFKKAGNYQVIRMGNVRPGIIRENESAVFIDKIDEKALSKALLIPKDVIITQTGTKNKRDYGFTVIIVKENYLLNQRIAAIRFSSQYLPEFFLYFSWTKLFKDQYFANETGTVGQGNVGIGAITESKVPYISIKEQQSIVRQIDALRAETQKLEAIYQQKLLNLEELKKSILQKAFSGELMSESGFQSFQDDMIK
jgi:type I restriction enzyme, S subunit